MAKIVYVDEHGKKNGMLSGAITSEVLFAFVGQDKALADNTHFNTYGAYEVSKMIVMGMKQLNLPLVKNLRPGFVDFDPARPDDFMTFKWVPSKNADIVKPDGN